MKLKTERISPDGRQTLKIFLHTWGGSTGNPRKDSKNISILHCQDGSLGDVNQSLNNEYYKETLAQIDDVALVKLPLYFTKFGQVKIDTTPFVVQLGDADRDNMKDNGFVGMAYTTKEKVTELGLEYLSEAQLKEAIQTEINEYSLFLNGEVYGFILYDNTTYEEGNSYLNEVDSQMGYLGDAGIETILDEHKANNWPEKEIEIEAEALSR